MNRLLILMGICTVQSVAFRIIDVILGGDYDENGCKPSAGYVWCNETNSCIPMNQLCLPEIPEIFLNLTQSEVLVPEM